MSLWLVYAILSSASGAVIAWTLAAVCPRAQYASGERGVLALLYLPLVAATVHSAFLAGWAIAEPIPADERVERGLCTLALVAALVAARAVARAVRSLLRASVSSSSVGTVGFARCRIVISEAYRRAASPEMLEAAIAHERAHARRHDPLRIWLAQFAADLQWPVASAQHRFRQWLLALEMSCDDEAVLAGTSPITLARSILLAARLESGDAGAPGTASVAGDGTGLALRVRRLLSGGPRQAPVSHGLVRWAPALLLAVLAAALWMGVRYGDHALIALR